MSMGRLRRAALAAAASLLGASALAVVGAGAPGPAGATASFSFGRTAGVDRFDTSSLTATGNFPASPTVIGASGVNFPDALSGAYLAGTVAGAILLLPSSGPVPDTILNALRALKTKNVILLGGTAAIGPDVASQLANTVSTSSQGGSLNVTRVAGDTRYDTNKLVVESPTTPVGTVGGKRTAIIASGGNFPDALSGGPLSYGRALPIILTDPNSLSPQARAALTDLHIQQVLIEGGSSAVSGAAEAAINALGIPTLQRFSGADRSDTSRLTGSFAISNLGFKNTTMDLASGDQSFGGADALSAAPAAGVNNTVMLVTNSVSDAGKVVQFAQTFSGTLGSGVAFGGTSPQPDAILTTVQHAAQANVFQAYTLTPSAPQNHAVSSNVVSDSSGAVAYTATNLGTANVDVMVVQASTVAISTSGAVTFTPAPGTSNASQGTVAAVITAVNGTTTAANSSIVTSVTPQNGQINFTVNSTNPESDIPVVFSRADGNDTLELNTSGQPSEPFGIGGSATWVPPQGAVGAINPGTVTAVNTDLNYFVLSTVFGGKDQVRTYYMKAADTFQLYQPPNTGGFIGGTCTNTNQQDFFTRLSLGDAAEGIYSTTGPSSFCLDDIAPAAPSSLIISTPPTNQATSSTVTIGDSPTPSVTSYNVYRQPQPAGGCAAKRGTTTDLTLTLGYSKVGSTNDADPGVGSGAAAVFTDTALSPATTYCYAATSVDHGDEGQTPLFATYSTSVAAAPSAPTSISTSSSHGGGTSPPLSVGDQLVVNFDQAISPVGAFSLTLGDGTNAATLNQNNAATSPSQGNSTLTIQVTQAVTGSPNPVIWGPNGIEAISATGIGNTVGGWNLAKSGEKAPGFSRVFGGTNAALPLPPAIVLASVTATGSNPANTVKVTACGSNPVTVYNALTAAVIVTPTNCLTANTGVSPSPALVSGETLIATTKATASPGSFESAPAFPPMAVLASGSAGANSITVNFSQPISCDETNGGAAVAPQFAYTPPGSAAAFGATSVSGCSAQGAGTIVLGFAPGRLVQSSSPGVLTYTKDSTPSDHLTGGTSATEPGVEAPNQNLSASVTA